MACVFICVPQLMRQRCFRLGHIDHRHKAAEQQEEGEKESEGTHQHSPVNPCGAEVLPCTRQVISRQGSNNDHESLKPHTDIHEYRNDENKFRIIAKSLEPEELRAHDVTGDHRPIGPPVGTESAVDKRKLFGWNLAIPCNEELCSVGETDNCARRKNDLAHIVEVANGN